MKMLSFVSPISSFSNKGSILDKLGHPEEVLSICEKVLELAPNFKEALDLKKAITRKGSVSKLEL